MTRRTALPVVRSFLHTGNSKLGEEIYSFSLPAGASCPGQSNLCANACYAKKGNFVGGNVQKKYADLYTITEMSPETLRDGILSEIRSRQIATVRIHASGDFYSLAYIDLWQEIIAECSSEGFYAYTRSWRIDFQRDALESVVRWSPNFRLWYSCDSETGIPGSVPDRIGLAWMMCHDDDVPPFPLRPDDVVFRVKRKSVQKRVALALVCPKENGTQSPALSALTCSTCRWCLPKKEI